MKFEISTEVLSGQKGTMIQSTDQKTGEVKKMEEPLHWASLQVVGDPEMEKNTFGLKPKKLPCTHEVFDQVRALWEKKKSFTFDCEMRTVRDRNGSDKMTPFAVALVGEK
ncbi:MAG: hypothetical protein AB7C96_04890 [Hydrogenovibrio sp.]